MDFAFDFIDRYSAVFAAGELADCPVFCLGELCCLSERHDRPTQSGRPLAADDHGLTDERSRRHRVEGNIGVGKRNGKADLRLQRWGKIVYCS